MHRPAAACRTCAQPAPLEPAPPFTPLPHSTCLQEIDELCEEWEPEPLYPALPPEQAAWKEPVISKQAGTQVGPLGWLQARRPLCRRTQAFSGPPVLRDWNRGRLLMAELLPCPPAAPLPPSSCKQVVVDGKTALNMASLNFLGIAGSEEVRRRGLGWAAQGGRQGCQQGLQAVWWAPRAACARTASTARPPPAALQPIAPTQYSDPGGVP